MNGIQEVSGSIPLISTKTNRKVGLFRHLRGFQANKQQRFDPADLPPKADHLVGFFFLFTCMLNNLDLTVKMTGAQPQSLPPGGEAVMVIAKSNDHD